MKETIKFLIKNKVGHIILNRPEKYNAINRELALSLQEKLDQFNTDENIRAVIIYGEGKAFCSGQDLTEAIGDVDFEKIINEHYNPIVSKISSFSKPIVAYVNGIAAGAGANLALCCDFVLASENAIFSQAFSKIGLIPDTGGTWFLPKLVGYHNALALTYTGEKISAQDAQKMGFVYKIFSADEALDSALKVIEQLANNPTKAFNLTKKLIQKSFSQSLDEQLIDEKKFQIDAGNSYDFKEGVTAFLEKRSPEFKGF